MRMLLIVIGLAHFAVGPVAFFAPAYFYETIPGVTLTGPFNMHFIRDAGIAFAVSGAAMAYGAANGARGVAIVGAAWPFLHALFHIQMQIGRGLPMDFVMVFDVFAVILPALIAMMLAWRLHALP